MLIWVKGKGSVSMCESQAVRTQLSHGLAGRPGTHGRGPAPRRCCPGSHCLHRTSSAPGRSDCWHRQTRPAGTGVGARRMGSLWAPQECEAGESKTQVLG